jgi:K(+)-stimulated pyrophosphate-energized sodium pump
MATYLTPLFGIIGLGLAAALFFSIKKQNAGGGLAEKISVQIQNGAMVFMAREFKLIALFASVLGLALFLFQDPAYRGPQSLAFFMGCLASSAAGFIGMKTATLANVRTTIAANESGATKALKIAFSGGAVMGLTVAAMGLIGLGSLFWYFEGSTHLGHILEGFAMGASLVALFYRVGGGIFTKALTSSANSKLAFPKMTRGTPASSQITSVITSVTLPAWDQTFSNPTAERKSPPSLLPPPQVPLTPLISARVRAC